MPSRPRLGLMTAACVTAALLVACQPEKAPLPSAQAAVVPPGPPLPPSAASSPASTPPTFPPASGPASAPSSSPIR